MSSQCGRITSLEGPAPARQFQIDDMTTSSSNMGFTLSSRPSAGKPPGAGGGQVVGQRRTQTPLLQADSSQKDVRPQSLLLPHVGRLPQHCELSILAMTSTQAPTCPGATWSQRQPAGQGISPVGWLKQPQKWLSRQ